MGFISLLIHDNLFYEVLAICIVFREQLVTNKLIYSNI